MVPSDLGIVPLWQIDLEIEVPADYLSENL